MQNERKPTKTIENRAKTIGNLAKTIGSVAKAIENLANTRGRKPRQNHREST